MELILISDSKLKVMLTADDMKQYEISCDMIDYDNGTPAETRRAFWRILDEAKMKTGFDAAGDRVFVQVYPSKSGGCEMFVTKLGIFIESSEPSEKIKDEKSEIPISHQKNTRAKKQKEKNKKVTYMFDNLNNLLTSCLRISNTGYTGKSSVYSDIGNGRYYITLDSEALPEFSGLGEYNAYLCSDAVSMYLREYCSCICSDDAIQTLGILV